MTKQIAHSKYRPDIDGLRAVAVFAVIGFHAFPEWLKGGFIGVDIFFVISGFLISTIIFSGLEQNKFSFVEFYSRRVKRIFPALIVVLIAGFTLGWFTLFADEYALLGKHIAGGAGFVANFVFWGESSYFDNAASTKPLLHLWSLGIEEQFYIIWPLLLWIAWKRRLNLMAVIIFIGSISFALNVNKAGVNPVYAFYSPQTRFWELLIGSALAYLTLYKKDLFAGAASFANHARSILGLILITIGLFLISQKQAFPGWWAVLPTVGTALIISAGAEAWLNRKILSNRALVWFGLISYPLYLWHWLLLSFMRIILGTTHNDPGHHLESAAAILLSVALAWLTYRLIEMPIRFGASGSLRTLVPAALIAVMGCLGYYTYEQGGFKGFGFRTPDRTEYSDYFTNTPPEWKYFQTIGIREKFRLECDFFDAEKFFSGEASMTPRATIDKTCFTRDARYEKSVIIWGDSHAQHLNFGLKNHLPENYQLLQIASSGCAPDITIRKPSTRNYCAQSNWFALKTIETIKPDVVIVAQSNGQYVSLFSDVSEKLHSLGASRVIFIGPTPHWTAKLPNIILRHLWHDTPQRTYVGIDEGVLNRNRMLQENFIQSEEDVFVNLIDFFCNESGCLTYIGNDKKTGITSFDESHLTPIASDDLAKNLLVDLIVRLTGK